MRAGWICAFWNINKKRWAKIVLPLSLLIWVDVTLVLETHVYSNVISCKTKPVGLCEPGAPFRAVGGAASVLWLCRALRCWQQEASRHARCKGPETPSAGLVLWDN